MRNKTVFLNAVQNDDIGEVGAKKSHYEKFLICSF